MPVESTADRLSFLSADEFGASATYITRGGSRSTLNGILNNPYLEVVGDVPAADVMPTFLCRAADLPDDAAGGDGGDQLIVSDVRYRVAELHPDGTGMTVVTLAARD